VIEMACCYSKKEYEHKDHLCDNCGNMEVIDMKIFPCATCFGAMKIPIAPIKQCNWKPRRSD